MTEITNRPAPQTPVVIEWVEEKGFEIRIEVRSGADARPFTPPALSSHDTGFYYVPPQF